MERTTRLLDSQGVNLDIVDVSRIRLDAYARIDVTIGGESHTG